jgi:hypothetical protein
LLYIHNCKSSKNVHDELRVVSIATQDLIKHYLLNKNTVSIIIKEFGVDEIEDLYKSRDSEVLVDNWIDVPVKDYIKEDG